MYLWFSWPTCALGLTESLICGLFSVLSDSPDFAHTLSIAPNFIYSPSRQPESSH